MEQEIDAFIRFLAVERGLSDNYQLSTRRSLTEFAEWCGRAREITRPRKVTLPFDQRISWRAKSAADFPLRRSS